MYWTGIRWISIEKIKSGCINVITSEKSTCKTIQACEFMYRIMTGSCVRSCQGHTWCHAQVIIWRQAWGLAWGRVENISFTLVFICVNNTLQGVLYTGVCIRVEYWLTMSGGHCSTQSTVYPTHVSVHVQWTHYTLYIGYKLNEKIIDLKDSMHKNSQIKMLAIPSCSTSDQ